MSVVRYQQQSGPENSFINMQNKAINYKASGSQCRSYSRVIRCPAVSAGAIVELYGVLQSVPEL